MRFKCVKCASCCKDKNVIVTLTHLDIIRLADFLNCDGRELLRNYLSFYQANHQLIEKLVFPALETYRGKAILGLRKRNDGTCVFLEGNLCSIYPARPMICRTFPFTFSIENGLLRYGLTIKAKKDCKGLGKGREVKKHELALIGEKAVRELESFRKIVAVWNKMVKEGFPAIPDLFIEAILKGAFSTRGESIQVTP